MNLRRALGRDGWPARSADDRMIAGVCGGVAARLGIDAVIVRIAFVALALAWVGVPAYLAAWVLLPRPRPRPAETARPARPAVPPPGPVRRRAAGLALIALGAVLLARHLGAAPPDAVLWPVLCAALGAGFVAWRIPVGVAGRAAAARVVGGTLLVAVGIGVLLAANLSLAAVRDGLLSTGLVVGGLALIVGPWVAVLVRDRRDERLRRIRADERSDMAAHLHDSVLQTLALIQRSDDPDLVSALARRQERELRSWLYADGSEPDGATVKAAVEHLAAVIEGRHGAVIDVVAVGDAPVDSAVESLVAAAGEAMTNAARWSGSSAIWVYVEATGDAVEVFVRDRGVGFDPEAVDDDRFGIRESIRGRLHRIGGDCEIVSSPGQGTEVCLRLPRN